MTSQLGNIPSIPPAAPQHWEGAPLKMDRQLPVWARRSHPIVRRELGDQWKRLLPNSNLLAGGVIAQCVLVLILPLGWLMLLTLPIILVAVFALPVTALIYGRTLLLMIYTSAATISDARLNHTLDLLRVSPLRLPQVLLAKLASGLWRRADDLELVVIALSALSLPILLIHYAGELDVERLLFSTRAVIVLALFALPIRAVAEPMMFGMLGIWAGGALPTRAAAVISVVAFGIFYYACLLIPSFMPVPLWGRVLAEIILPLALPAILTPLALRMATHTLENEL